MPFNYKTIEEYEDLKFTGSLLYAFEEAEQYKKILGLDCFSGYWKGCEINIDLEEWECIDTIYKNGYNFELFKNENNFIRYNNGKYEYWADTFGSFKSEFVLRCGLRDIDFRSIGFRSSVYVGDEWKPIYKAI